MDACESPQQNSISLTAVSLCSQDWETVFTDGKIQAWDQNLPSRTHVS